MQKNARTRSIALAGLVAIAVAGFFVAFGMRPDGIANYYRDTLSPVGFAVWLSGLIVATLSPPIVAIICWFGAKKMPYGWLLHLLLLPVTYAAVRGLSSGIWLQQSFLLPVTYAAVRGAIAIMLTATNERDSDGLTGWATDPAAMLMLLCPLVYFAALGFTKLRRPSARASIR